MRYDTNTNAKMQDSLDTIEILLDTLLEENLIEQVYGDNIRHASRELDVIRGELQEDGVVDYEKVQDFVYNLETSVDDMKAEIKEITRDLGL